jgi:hypothetical protein
MQVMVGHDETSLSASNTVRSALRRLRKLARARQSIIFEKVFAKMDGYAGQARV